MASPWTLERFGGLTGTMSRRLPQAIGSLLERAFTRRPPAEATAEDDRRRALRHVVSLTCNSNQGLLDVRWGDPGIVDDRWDRHGSTARPYGNRTDRVGPRRSE